MKDKSFGSFSREVLAFADTHPVKRFVIDLRENDGGDSSLAQPLITGIKQRATLNQRGHLFVIVGRGTFSSAILNALDLKNKTQAIFVGEPTGGKPNHYGEFQEFTLPNSRLRVGYSTKYFTYSQDDTPFFVPDVPVELSSADYFAGRDPMLDAILAYQEK
jgi:C-terminal processing protease CtpA/Prc